MPTTVEERQRLKVWESYIEGLFDATPIDPSMSESDKKKLRDSLETDPVGWIRYFFPNYCTYPFAPFHRKAIRRIVNNPEWYEVLSWSRELAKSTVVMCVVMFLVLTGRKRNVILASATVDAAERLLAPYKKILEENARIRTLYGEQVNLGQWTSTNFVTKDGASFLAVGAGSAPRGSRNKAVRPDVIIVDDFDTDEDCRNPDTLNKKWDWFEKALYPTRSLSEPTTIIFCGNIIAKDTCIARAGKMADHWDIVNVRDRNGKSTWPEKNSEEHIDRVQNTISQKAFQGEYMNNPISEGAVFKNLPFGKIPALPKFKFLVCYGDPAYSNRKNKGDSTKAVGLIGRIGAKYYIIKCFIARETNANYIGWFYEMKAYVNGRCPVYYYQENNALQDPFFEQVFQPLIRQANKDRCDNLYITGDNRAKMDKATRIEATLEPIDRNGAWMFNEEEKDNPHMKELISQFELFEMSLPYCADGPDMIEGGITILDSKIGSEAAVTDTIAYKDLTSHGNRM